MAVLLNARPPGRVRGCLRLRHRVRRRVKSRTKVALVREHFFTPRLWFKTYDEMNAWLLDRFISYAEAITIRN